MVDEEETLGIINRALSGWNDNDSVIEDEICKEDELHSIEHQEGNKFRNIVNLKIINTNKNYCEAS